MTTRPTCEDCGSKLVCRGCDDTRPTADDLYRGWRLLTPFGRYETIEKTSRPAGEFGPVVISTKETPGYAWRYFKHEKVYATPPEADWTHGTPEVRVFEGSWRDSAIYAIATSTATANPNMAGHTILAEAHDAGRGKGWKVHHRPEPTNELVVIDCESKAKARSTVRALAREYAKKMGVKVRIAE